MKRSKYGNKPVVIDGVRFASKAEAKRDAELQWLAINGDVCEIVRQPRFLLKIGDRKICTYVGDWQYFERTEDGDWQKVVEDKKGVLTAAFRLKWKLCQALYPEIEWRLS